MIRSVEERERGEIGSKYLFECDKYAILLFIYYELNHLLINIFSHNYIYKIIIYNIFICNIFEITVLLNKECSE